MSGPGAAVAPRNSGYEGGTLRAATRPTDVGGAFSASLSASVPTAVAGGEIYSARQSRGSNIRIPQSRLVPLSGPQCKLPCKTIGLLGASTEHRLEDSNLKPGELAWILGRVFKPDGGGNDGSNQSAVAASLRESEAALLKHIGADALRELFKNDGTTTLQVRDRIIEAIATKNGDLEGRMRPEQNMGGQVNLGTTGTHHGFDHARFERLASTDWVESYVQNVLNQKGAEKLLTVGMFSNATAHALDSDLEKYGQERTAGLMSHASLFAAPDVAYALSEFYHATYQGEAIKRPDLFATEVPKSDMAEFKAMPGGDGDGIFVGTDRRIQVLGPQLQGLFVLEDGPFLRSMCLDDSAVKIRNGDDDSDVNAMYERRGLDIVPRNLGSLLCHKALYQHLRQMGLMNWTPDGIVLSKFDTGNGAEDEGFFDAAMGQLYNVGVQGPTITRSWSENIENLHMHRTTAMDRVFVLVVGRVTYELGEGTKKGSAVANHMNAMATITKAARNGRNNIMKRVNAAKKVLAKLVEGTSTSPRYTIQRKAYVEALLGYVASAGSDEEGEKKQALLDAKRSFENVAGMGDGGNTASDFEKLFNAGLDDKGRLFKEAQTKMRKGEIGVAGAELSDLRLMRATSAFLINNSNPRNARESARVGRRCGLQAVSFSKEGNGSAEFILGGWSIGSVLDTAASRAALSVSQTSVKPETHALNVNVGVEWWTADDLYNAYMDIPAKPDKDGKFANEGSVRSLREPEMAVYSDSDGKSVPYYYQPDPEGISVDNNNSEGGHTHWAAAAGEPGEEEESEEEEEEEEE